MPASPSSVIHRRPFADLPSLAAVFQFPTVSSADRSVNFGSMYSRGHQITAVHAFFLPEQCSFVGFEFGHLSYLEIHPEGALEVEASHDMIRESWQQLERVEDV